MGEKEPEDELNQLAREVRKLVDENRRFLDRILDDEFEAEDGQSEEELPVS